jgi:hypothetical protein
MSCHKGDWIVKGVEGEVYAIKNAIFESYLNNLNLDRFLLCYFYIIHNHFL